MSHQYVQTADVQGQFKSLTFSVNSTPTSAQLDDFIDEEESSAEASIGMKYQVPIDSTASPKAFKIVRKTVLELVAGRVKNILTVKSGADAANQGKVSDGDSMIQRAEARLKAIRNGDIKLADATLASANDGVRSFNVENSDACGSLDDESIEDQGSTINGRNPLVNVPAFRRKRVMW